MATPQPAMWQVLLDRLPRDGRWRPLDRLYRLVQDGIDLDAEDMEAARRGASPPRWKRNVRNVLQYRRQTGEVEWDGDASYRFPSTPKSWRVFSEGDLSPDMGPHGGEATPDELGDGAP